MKVLLFNCAWCTNRFYLVIERRYVSPHPIVPLGSDCHPAQVLKVLHIRKKSFPFDWLYTPSPKGVDYVNKNIKENFKYFLDRLMRNEKGDWVSEHYPHTQFLHYHNLNENHHLLATLARRAKRFLQLFYGRKRCLFLYNVNSNELKTTDDVFFMVNSIKEFHTLANNRHRFLLYIRYDESVHENEALCNMLVQELGVLSNTSIVRYIRHKKTFGIWGDESKYPELLRSLDISIRQGFPKFYFKKERFETSAPKAG